MIFINIDDNRFSVKLANKSVKVTSDKCNSDTKNSESTKCYNIKQASRFLTYKVKKARSINCLFDSILSTELKPILTNKPTEQESKTNSYESTSSLSSMSSFSMCSSSNLNTDKKKKYASCEGFDLNEPELNSFKSQMDKNERYPSKDTSNIDEKIIRHPALVKQNLKSKSYDLINDLDRVEVSTHKSEAKQSFRFKKNSKHQMKSSLLMQNDDFISSKTAQIQMNRIYWNSTDNLSSNHLKKSATKQNKYFSKKYVPGRGGRGAASSPPPPICISANGLLNPPPSTKKTLIASSNWTNAEHMPHIRENNVVTRNKHDEIFNYNYNYLIIKDTSQRRHSDRNLIDLNSSYAQINPAVFLKNIEMHQMSNRQLNLFCSRNNRAC